MPTLFHNQKRLFRTRFAILLTLLVVMPGFLGEQPVIAAESSVSEHELKAVYLYNFLRFATWPEEKSGESGVKVIAVVGHSPMEKALKRLQAKLVQSGKGSSISMTFHGSYRAGMPLRDCHILYVANSEKINFAKIIDSLGHAPVLTVAEGDSFLQAGGMIALLRHNNSVRWAINRQSLALAGLRLSAKLLEMAVSVVGNESSFENEGECIWLASVI